MNLENLYTVLVSRKKDLPFNSYASFLFKKGKDAIVQKIGEEATEVVIAAKNTSKKRVIEEVSDLLFMILILLSFLGITLEDIYKELGQRNKKGPYFSSK